MTILDLLVPESVGFIWLEHEKPIRIGPFNFDTMIPVPVADTENILARHPWLQVPFGNRRIVPSGLEGDHDDALINGEELFDALQQGHLSTGSDDYFRLVDHVGRCLLIHASFGKDLPYHDECEQIFASIKEGSIVFDVLVRRARGHVDEGIVKTETEASENSLFAFVIARILYYGAHMLSPNVPGILYELGVLLHDIISHVTFDKEEDQKFWIETLASESQYFLQMGMSDKDLREGTPASLILGKDREMLGNVEDALAAYNRFLKCKAADRFPHMREEALQKIKDLSS
jgi:hypothetical protein